MTTRSASRKSKEPAPVAVAAAVPNKKAKMAAKKTKLTAKPQVLPLNSQNSIIRTVLDRLNGKTVILHGIDRTKTDLMSNLKCAVNDYRGNSSILIGPRASGKSTLIKQLIDRTIKENSETHIIDTLILQGSIFSETQSVLKYLLAKFKAMLNISTAATSINEEEETSDLSEFMAFDQLSALVKQYFAANFKNTKKRFLIFVLEDLEKFAAHPQQNLLYCLFELALSSPVFVIGTSCRIDVLELLEKRVKSRFSQNIVYLPLPETLEDFRERIKTNLIVNEKGLEIYNESIEDFIENNECFKNICSFNFDFTKDVRPVFRSLTSTFAAIDQSESFDWKSFSELFDSINGPARPELTLNQSITETTIVELMIIVAMCRLAAKFPSTPVTFDVILDELLAFKCRAPGLEHFTWTKSTLQVAFDRLLNCRILLQTSNTVASASNSTWIDRSYLTVRLGLPTFIVLDAIEKHPFNSKELFALACEKF